MLDVVFLAYALRPCSSALGLDFGYVRHNLCDVFTEFVTHPIRRVNVW